MNESEERQLRNAKTLSFSRVQHQNKIAWSTCPRDFNLHYKIRSKVEGHGFIFYIPGQISYLLFSCFVSVVEMVGKIGSPNQCETGTGSNNTSKVVNQSRRRRGVN